MDDRGQRIYEVVRLVRPMTLNSARVVEANLRRAGLTVGMRAVMEVVATSGPMTVPEIARTLDVSRQAAQRLVNELVEGRHVRLTMNPRHQRSLLVDLTQRGSRAFARLRAEETEQLAGLAPDVSDEDLATTFRVMSALAGDIRRRVHRSAEPAHLAEEGDGG